MEAERPPSEHQHRAASSDGNSLTDKTIPGFEGTKKPCITGEKILSVPKTIK